MIRVLIRSSTIDHRVIGPSSRARSHSHTGQLIKKRQIETCFGFQRAVRPSTSYNCVFSTVPCYTNNFFAPKVNAKTIRIYTQSAQLQTKSNESRFFALFLRDTIIWHNFLLPIHEFILEHWRSSDKTCTRLHIDHLRAASTTRKTQIR